MFPFITSLFSVKPVSVHAFVLWCELMMLAILQCQYFTSIEHEDSAHRQRCVKSALSYVLVA